MSIRVVIADDHPVVREGLRLKIESSGKDITIVGEASDGQEVLKIAKTRAADVAILDMVMPNMNGIEAVRRLAKEAPATKAIILSLHDTKPVVLEALAAGARGYLTKDLAVQTVIEAVREVYAGRYYLSPRIAHFVIEDAVREKKGARKASSEPALTGQERRVLQLIAEGHSNKEIAATMDLAVNTIHAHRHHLAVKLDIHKQADLVHYAIKEGIAKL